MTKFGGLTLALVLFGSVSAQAGDWPLETRNTFRQSCINSATDALAKQQALSYCDCTVERVARDFSTSEIAELDKTKLSAPLIKRLQQVSQQCLAALGAQR